MKKLTLFTIIVLLIVVSNLPANENGGVVFEETNVYEVKMDSYLTVYLPENGKYELKNPDDNWETEILANVLWVRPSVIGASSEFVIENGENQQIVLSVKSCKKIEGEEIKKLIVKRLFADEKIQEQAVIKSEESTPEKIEPAKAKTIEEKRKAVEKLQKEIEEELAKKRIFENGNQSVAEKEKNTESETKEMTLQKSIKTAIEENSQKRKPENVNPPVVEKEKNVVPIMPKEKISVGNETEGEDKTQKDSSKKKMDIQTLISVMGGTQKHIDSQFVIDGELAVAGKSESGLLVQGAGIFSVNEMIKKYGFSLGAGYEPNKLGIFIFGDLLSYKFSEYDATLHFQIRPALRLKSENLAGELFVGIPVLSEKYTGFDVVDNEGTWTVYNKSLFHFGFDVKTSLLDKLLIDFYGVVASGSVYKVQVGASYLLLDCILAGIQYEYSSFGDYPQLIGDGYTNSSRLMIQLSYSKGAGQRVKDLRKLIIVKPDYPIVVSYKKEKVEDNKKELEDNGDDGNNDGNTGTLTVTLDAAPKTGAAPHPVDFEALFGSKPSDSNGPYKYTWYYKSGKTEITSEKLFSHTYPTEGKYEAYVKVIDESKGYEAESNRVEITVLKTGTKVFTITATHGDNGTIDPVGEVTCEKGSDKKFTFSPNTGYVAQATVDGGSPFFADSYTFSDIAESHKIHVDFVIDPGTTYTITSSSGEGGSNNPEGSIEVGHGDNLTVQINPDPGYAVDDVRVNGSSVGSVTSYEFSNITSNGSISSTFVRSTYTVSASAGANGTVSPSGDQSVDPGDDITFTASPSSGYQVSQWYLDGSPAGTGNTLNVSNVTDDHTVYVEFEQIVWTITVTYTYGGSVSPSGDVAVVDGTNQTLTINPASGFRIGFWEVDGVRTTNPSGNTYTFSDCTTNHTFHVSFANNEYDITATRNTGGTISPSGTTTYERGDNATYSISANTNYCIDRVIVDGSVVYNPSDIQTTYSYNFTNIQDDHEIRAEFIRIYRMQSVEIGYVEWRYPDGTFHHISTEIDETYIWYVKAGSSYTTPTYPLQKTVNGYLMTRTYFRIDGSSIGGTSYTFSNITANHEYSSRYDSVQVYDPD